ncbi:MAG: hypothetical protein IKO44_05185 [Ruminococcus sp.]|nr:hypothetical protein [Ruminococcus sp.]MBR4622914.1 hypothetical protein [Ruminococcus sp.]
MHLKWGCDFHFKDAAAPLPLAFGVDDSPEAIYDYYIDYVKKYCEMRNNIANEDGKIFFGNVTDILGIRELDDMLVVLTVFDDFDEGKIKIPYPPK